MRKQIKYTTMSFLLIMLLAVTANAQDTARNAPDVTLFKNVMIFDGVNNKLTSGEVLVENNLIKAVGAVNNVPQGATVIDGGGRTLMPGLIESHVHLNLVGAFGSLAEGQATDWDVIGATSVVYAEDFLADGYTTVRDVGGASGVGVKRVIDRGIAPGPRIYAGGSIISQTSGHADWMTGPEHTSGVGFGNMERLNISVTADGVPDLRKAVRRNFAFQASHIKICTGGGVSSILDPLDSSGFSMEEIKAVVDETNRYNTYTTVHAYQDLDIRRSIEAGVKCIEHGHMIEEETMKLLVEKGVFLSMNTSAVSPDISNVPNYAPGTPSGKKLAIVLEAVPETVRLIKKYKPILVHNVDSVLVPIEMARNQRDHEKWMFAKFFGNFETLKSMTSNGGKLCELAGNRGTYQDGKLGVIEPGAYADILLVDGNPLEDLACLGANDKLFTRPPRTEVGHKTIPFIMKDGKVYKNELK
jgi:imidazolonepropionase-like amidohydrolase